MTNYSEKEFASQVYDVKEETLLKVESSMVMKPIIIGSYYKNRKQVHNLQYWMKAVADQDVEKLAQLKQA